MTKNTSINNNLSTLVNNSLNKRKMQSNDKKYIPDNFKKVAKSYEKQFARLMVEQMNKTVSKQKKNSTADRYYQDLLTDKRTDLLTKTNGGMGIQDLILNQIYPKRMRNELTFNNYKKQFSNNKIVKQNPYSNIKMKQESHNE